MQEIVEEFGVGEGMQLVTTYDLIKGKGWWWQQQPFVM